MAATATIPARLQGENWQRARVDKTADVARIERQVIIDEEAISFAEAFAARCRKMPARDDGERRRKWLASVDAAELNRFNVLQKLAVRRVADLGALLAAGGGNEHHLAEKLRCERITGIADSLCRASCMPSATELAACMPTAFASLLRDRREALLNAQRSLGVNPDAAVEPGSSRRQIKSGSTADAAIQVYRDELGALERVRATGTWSELEQVARNAQSDPSYWRSL